MKKNFMFLCFIVFMLVFVPFSCAKQSPHTYDVVIIGAGAAGLGAAQKLQDAHKDILVIEARDRIGGRVQTVNNWGSPIDLGASWIHGIENNPLTEIAKQTATNIMPAYYDDNNPSAIFKDMQTFDPNGVELTPVEMALLSQQAEQFIVYLKRNGKKDVLFSTLFDNFVKAQHILDPEKTRLYWAVRLMYSHEYAVDLGELPTQNEMGLHVSVSGANALLQQGFIRLFNYLALKTPMQFNQIVTHIAYNKSGVQITTKNNVYFAKKVIITVPLGVLKSGKIHFSPSLPEWKQTAINKLEMGSYNKTYLMFERPFWGEHAPEIVEYIPSWEKRDTSIEIMNMYKFTHKPILLVFAAGADANRKENLSDKENVAEIMQTLRKMYGNNIPEPSAFMQTRWGKDPFSLGAYSYLPVGAEPRHIKLLQKTVDDRLYFAGEATSLTDSATVHGAYTTGVQAAEKIINGFEAD